jgi:cell division protease FtsH
MIAFLFGGRAAEKLIFDDITTGAGNDIERATEIARKMVCEWGMSDKLGPQSYEKSEGPVFLGMSYGNKSREYSDSKAEEIDKEVNSIIDVGYKLAMQVLTENKDALERLAQALLEFESIDSTEVELLVNGTAISEIRKIRSNKGDGSGLTVPVQDATAAKNKIPTGGSDPVGQPGSATT